jgi:hypothetical protein
VLVESSSNFVALINNDGGKILGVVTLHDLLCAKLNWRCLDTFGWLKPVVAASCETFFSPASTAIISFKRLASPSARNLEAMSSVTSSDNG